MIQAIVEQCLDGTSSVAANGVGPVGGWIQNGHIDTKGLSSSSHVLMVFYGVLALQSFRRSIAMIRGQLRMTVFTPWSIVVGEFAAATMFTHSANHASFGSARISDLSMVAIAYFSILITQGSAAPATLL